MPWQEVTQVEQRAKFIELALLPGANISAICRTIGISRKTGYKWLSRYAPGNLSSLEDRSRRPKVSPNELNEATKRLILSYRDKYPTWGGRKIRGLLIEAGHTIIPSASTITEVLRRNNKLSLENSKPNYCRFERADANELWQMDFKGHFGMITKNRCHPLTIIDDHSRFSICLQACEDEKKETVKKHLISCFRQYGMPLGINTDNGSPWGNSGLDDPTHLTIWLMKCGIKLSHSRPYHPQTNGKNERFHRTLKQELINQKTFHNIKDTQEKFDQWRHVYNHIRPHEGIGLQTPSRRYRPSKKPYPEQLLPVEYGEGQVRKVDKLGKISFQCQPIRVGKAFVGEYIAVKETDQDGVYSIFFMHSLIKKIDLRVSDIDN